MPKRSSKKAAKKKAPKRDFNQIAFDVVARATGQKTKESTVPQDDALDDPDVRKALMREMGSRGGKKGGKARAAKLTAKERSEIAKKAAQARWKNQKPS